ncbi:tRNA (adenosine(37)-N6)-threonylcarbamoyltransferase complex dimerization subunit type 1 TsaB [Roseovarius faecimaris]|uniref:tRNA (Adenosine(37)-N6)-threonylcarbamoyltransferase complex dimerization subunit type 1 TsaB n=1 Tax=Roseovarius faecimaris TaxID=2494550 RepID=A0A6I6IMG7_9RHOB|nr:tRNA (adenosine(37)-N6)-threonylcarbamoyltransferase complex dimerization subunit type 1 TsaB [Roseovarius faecimaris]QGX97284.1 tRNA (adenosine(37)-N6)-threonylcarbamoyltransferase complex dimerization subunit type 1 TsaB [Roseovarius faecimaris]
MASDPLVLAFDTSAAHCAAALLLDQRVVTRVEEMGRGQAERLVPMLEELLQNEGADWSDIQRLGVGTGPGNFTGIRISVSLARGLSLSLGVPAIGVSGLDALRAVSTQDMAAIPGPRDTAYVQIGDEAPAILPRDEVPVGAEWLTDPARLVTSIAELAAKAPADAPAPAPLYLKPADAAPARDAPPVILDDA